MKKKDKKRKEKTHTTFDKEVDKLFNEITKPFEEKMKKTKFTTGKDLMKLGKKLKLNSKGKSTQEILDELDYP